jgi:hypothetical protein
MGKKLVITLDESTTSQYLELAGKKTEAEVNAECMPSGSSLTIRIAPRPYDNNVIFGENIIGIASVDVVDD